MEINNTPLTFQQLKVVQTIPNYQDYLNGLCSGGKDSSCNNSPNLYYYKEHEYNLIFDRPTIRFYVYAFCKQCFTPTNLLKFNRKLKHLKKFTDKEIFMVKIL